MPDSKVTPSSLFIKEDVAPAAEGDEEGAPELIKIEWFSKEGLPTNIDLVKKEFEKERTLRPMKTLLYGPPCSGKHILVDNLPNITMYLIIQWESLSHYKIYVQKQ